MRSYLPGNEPNYGNHIRNVAEPRALHGIHRHRVIRARMLEAIPHGQGNRESEQ